MSRRYNTGLYNLAGPLSYPADNTGLHAHTRKPEDVGKFRVPTLRNIAVTAPYMHDGSIPTLEGVLDHYASGGHRSRFRSRAIGGFKLTPGERADLLAFLHSLTDEALLQNPAFGAPR